MKTVKFKIVGLDCANCAKKIENKLNDSKDIDHATLNYAGQTLTITAPDPLENQKKYQSIIDSVEDGVTISEYPKTKRETEEEESNNIELFQIILGASIFLLSWIFESYLSPTWELIFQLIAYIILGGEIILKAFKNVLKGDFFDENFLMSVASIGALILGDYHEGVGVILFYRIGEFFEDYAVDRSRKQIMDAIDLRPETVNIINGSTIAEIPADQAQINDLIQVRPGDRIPLDGVVISGTTFIDTSPITGEPVPIKVTVGDELLSGSINQDTVIELKVTKPLSESMVTKILDSVENAAANKPQIDRFITRFSKIYTPIVLALALIVAIVPSLITGDWYHWIYSAITFLVISCPCALVLSVPLAYFCGIGAASRLGILFKGGNSIEALNNIKEVVFDKTGTITEGNFKVQQIDSVGISKKELLQIAASCESSSTHPIAKSIISEAQKERLKISAPSNIKEIAGEGIIATINNDEYLCGNEKLLKKFNIAIINKNKEFGTKVYVATRDKYLGCIVISDTIKENAQKAINNLKKNNLKTAMLTGDSNTNASTIGSKLGINHIYSSLLPNEKVEKLALLREHNGSCLFIGDGINDAPVLAGADVGAAMGSGSDAAIEASDIVFMTSDLDAVVTAYKIGKKTAKIAWENVVIALGIKAIILVLGLLGFANMWFAVFADTGVSLICILNSIRILYSFRK